MKRKSFEQLVFLLLVLLFAHIDANADTFAFNTIPSGGVISGPAGSTIGWGYSITNSSVTSSSPCRLDQCVFQ